MMAVRPNHPVRAARARGARAYGRLLEACGLLAGGAFGLLAVLITIDVAIRNLGIAHLGWLLETSEYTLYVATFIAAPWVLHLGSHVRVDLLLNAVPARLGVGLELAADAIGALVAAVLLFYGLDATLKAHAGGWMIAKTVVLPEWPLLAVIPASMALLTIEFLLRIRRTLTGAPSAAATREGL
jgi:TRAP-type C4-dicarboxylate transport system permease small subunit